MLVKNFTKIGNSYAVLIDRNILEMLDINPESSMVQVKTDGEGIYILPLRDTAKKERGQKINQIYDDLSRRYHKTFQNLAK